MIPILSAEEMRAVDAAAPEPVEVLIDRAGAAVARVALDMLGGTYGRRVVVVAGKGNNGADGRAAARRLAARGVRVEVIDAASAPPVLPASDLVIDAAYGTGFHGEYAAPDAGDAPVLSVDVPSGGVVDADVVVTFAALKPTLLGVAAPITVADIGLDMSGARAHLVEDSDVRSMLPARPVDAHKYLAAVLVVAGSPGMLGAPGLVAEGALRSGSGYCRMLVPGLDPAARLPVAEAVGVPAPADQWADAALDATHRMKAVAVGPGLGRAPFTLAETCRFVERCDLPTVVDADAIVAVAEGRGRLSSRAIVTPHEGEFARLTGSAPGPDRLDAVRAAAQEVRANVLLKGPVTVVSDPEGRCLVSMTGGPWLATAGTGDVLAGVIAAFLAMGLPPLEAGALAAHAHGAAARGSSRRTGLMAGDLPGLISAWLSAR